MIRSKTSWLAQMPALHLLSNWPPPLLILILLYSTIKLSNYQTDPLLFLFQTLVHRALYPPNKQTNKQPNWPPSSNKPFSTQTNKVCSVDLQPVESCSKPLINPELHSWPLNSVTPNTISDTTHSWTLHMSSADYAIWGHIYSFALNEGDED